MADTTLTRMAEGGMYDQIGGGFHRYSVDEHWLVPHFEKMLYDNAMLARVYLLAGRAFGSAAHERIARETLDYLLREMTPAGGGFFAAQDADSGGEEGTFYVWTPEELRETLGADTAAVVAARFGVTEAGNFEGGTTVLSVVRAIPDLAGDFRMREAEIEAILERSRQALHRERSKRVAPATDDKLLTDWSALAISAFALAGGLLREPRYEAAATAAADRILTRCRRDGELLHRERGRIAGIPAFAPDYANLVEALLDLYEATLEPRWFREALALQARFEERFADARGGYALSAAGTELVLRPREISDGATPSSNSVAASNLLRLHAFTGQGHYRDRAEAVFSAFSSTLTRAPSALPRMLCALDRAVTLPRNRSVRKEGPLGLRGAPRSGLRLPSGQPDSPPCGRRGQPRRPLVPRRESRGGRRSRARVRVRRLLLPQARLRSCRALRRTPWLTGTLTCGSWPLRENGRPGGAGRGPESS